MTIPYFILKFGLIIYAWGFKFEIFSTFQNEEPTDSEIARLARHISPEAMKQLAVETLGFTDAEVRTIEGSMRDDMHI